jgi:hypothetical protein
MDPQTRHTFIVKMWREGRIHRGLPVEWRMSVRHVRSGKLAYFRDHLLGLRFMQDMCGERSELPGDRNGSPQ